MTLAIPEAILDQHVVVLGKTGAYISHLRTAGLVTTGSGQVEANKEALFL